MLHNQDNAIRVGLCLGDLVAFHLGTQVLKSQSSEERAPTLVIWAIHPDWWPHEQLSLPDLFWGAHQT